MYQVILNKYKVLEPIEGEHDIEIDEEMEHRL